jgi:hypothetical protein
MCTSDAELKALDIDELLRRFKRAIVLDTKDSGNGHTPFDENQLGEEIKRRLNEQKK